MAAQTFNATAVIGLIDNMSGPMRVLASQMKQIAQTIDGGKFDTAGASAYSASLARANKEAREHVSLLGKMSQHMTEYRKTYNGVAAAVGAPAALLARTALSQIPKEKTIQEEEAKAQAYLHMTDKGVAETRRVANTEGVKLKGGAEGTWKETLEALRVGAPEAIAPRVALIGQSFADMIGEPVGQGLEKLIATAEYFNRLTNEKGEKQNVGMFYQGLLEKGMAEDQALAEVEKRLKAAGATYMRIANIMPGSEQELFEALKRTASTGDALKTPLRDIVSTLLMLKTAGYSGKEAGQIVNRVMLRGANPTFVAMRAAKTAGVDLLRNASFNEKFYDPDNIVAGLGSDYRSILEAHPEIEKRIRKTVTDFRSKIADTPEEEQSKLLDTATADIARALQESRGKYDKGPKVGEWVLDSATAERRARAAMQLGVEGASFLETLKYLKDEQKALTAVLRKVYGMESTGPLAQVVRQDIDGVQKQIDGVLKGTEGNGVGSEFDAMVKAKAESLFSLWEGVAHRVTALFDSLVDHNKDLIKGGLNTTNDALDAGIKDKGNGNAIVGFTGGGLMALGGAALPYIPLIGAAPLVTAASPFILGGGVAVAGASAAYLAYHNMPDAFSGPMRLATDKPKGMFAGPADSPWRKPPEFKPTEWGPQAPIMNAAPSSWSPQWDQGKSSTPTTVNGQITGTADVKVVVETLPTPLLETRLRSLEAGQINLNGRLGGDKLGTNYSGSTGAQPSVGGIGHQ